MTIKLTADDRVLEALKQAFSKYKPEQKLNKYLGVLEQLIFTALQFGQTPMQRKLNLYSISTHTLAQKGGCIGSNKVRMHKWLADNGLALIEVVDKGSNLNGKLSECKLTSLVTLENALSMPTGGTFETMTDREIEILLEASETEEEQDKLLELIYPGYGTLTTTEQISEQYHIVEIDTESLKSYIHWLSKEAKHYNAAKKATALRQARIILAVAGALNGKYLQRKKSSQFGRTYYEGISVQSVNKDLRRAMLGNGWGYDIRSSVISWKMGFAKEYINATDSSLDLRRVFSATLNYLEDKQDFVATVRHYTFKSDSNCEPDLQKKLIKQALTAISFGARMSVKGWMDDSGEIQNPALVDILKNAEERERFANCPVIRDFIHEQKLLDDYIYGQAKQHAPELLKLKCLQTHSGRSSKAKVLAYLYQHAETQVMDIVKQIAKEHRKKVLAHIHDAIVLKTRFGVDLKHEIELQMQEQTGNPYWRLAAEELKRFELRGQ
jgi:hypothetical protein